MKASNGYVRAASRPARPTECGACSRRSARGPTNRSPVRWRVFHFKTHKGLICKLAAIALIVSPASTRASGQGGIVYDHSTDVIRYCVRNDHPLRLPPQGGNRLLSMLGSSSRALLDQHLRSIDVRIGSVLCWADHAIDHAFFPDGAILSVLTVLADGSAIETAKIGREGAFGLFEAMYTHTSFNQCVVLLGGRLLRCPFGVLRFLLENNSEIRSLYICYTEALHAQSQQVAACSTLHSVRERLCRWLLTLHDRSDGQEFAITQMNMSPIYWASTANL